MRVLLSLLLFALATGAVAGAEVEIKGPSTGIVGEPVVIQVITDGVTIEVKRGFHESDIWLELYDSNRVPTKVFWSKVAGTRDLIVFTATKGPEVEPEVAVAEYTLRYNLNPDPIPEPNPIPEPSEDLKERVSSLLAFTGVSRADAETVAAFYATFAKTIKSDTKFKTTSDFRDTYIAAGKAALAPTLKGKYPNFGATIDKIIMAELGSAVVNLTPKKRSQIADIFTAIAWALYERGTQ